MGIHVHPCRRWLCNPTFSCPLACPAARPRRVTHRRTAALQPRAADRAHPALPNERPPLLRRRFNRRETTKSTGRGQAPPNACASKNHTSSGFGALARAVDERKHPRGVLSRTSRPRSAGFCFSSLDSDSEHSISEPGILSLNSGILVVQQQIARPKSVGIVILSYDLLLGGQIWSCMHARSCG